MTAGTARVGEIDGFARLPLVVDLTDPAATDPSLTGGKASNLATAARAGFDVLPGVVLTTAATAAGALGDAAVGGDAAVEALHEHWGRLGEHGRHPLVVRSSSTVEDASTSSMAGQFTSVLDVRTWPEMRDAVDRVMRSAARVGAEEGARPMAVLVQRQLDARLGGVVFGVDPVAGDPEHVVVDVVPGRPDELVSGRVRAVHYVLTRRGRVVEARDADAAPPLSPAHRRALARLARRTAKAFDAPQDVEWAIDTDGKLWLLQSRPVTAIAEPGSGPLLGPGPVAETFPVPLRALEQDLFLEPLREGIVRSLVATNAVTPHRLRESPVLTAVGGRVAVDLELLGIVQGRRSKWRLLDPRPGLRRLRAAWQVGRLRTALPDLVTETVDRIDADLTGVGPLDALDDDALLDVLDATRRELATAHSFEVLVGMLRREEPTGAPAAAVALRALARGRRDGLTDDAIVARDPVVLALVPPSLDGPVALPQEAATHGRAPADVGAIDARDALRLRSRWIQELLVRVARELGDRLVARGTIASARSVRDLTLDELHDLVDGAPAPADLDERAARPDGPPLPPAFRLTEHGAVAPKRVRGHETEGTPAGGGRGEGWVRHRAGVTDRPTVLVVRHLEPQLASALPGLAGLVSETGSPLSHLAILAREFGVPTVVAVDDACRRFPPGTVLLVDGTTGEVRALDDESQGSAR